MKELIREQSLWNGLAETIWMKKNQTKNLESDF